MQECRQGQVPVAAGPERVELDADVRGEIGALRVRGPAVVMPPRWGGDSLQIDFRNLDLRALRGSGPTSDLTGGVFVVETLSVMIQVASFRLFGRRVFRMAPIHHHFQLRGWPETTVIIRFWILSGMCTAVGLGLYYADFIGLPGARD